MITIETSRAGVPILKVEGRALASTFDPLKEAASWAQSVEATLAPGTAAVILGAGCGYHVAALKLLCPRSLVVALEPSREVADRALEFNPSLKDEDVVVETDLLRLTEQPRVRDALGGVFVPVRHGPSAHVSPQWTESMAAFLAARDKLSFLLQLRMRPDLFALLDPAKIEALGNEAISIKTLQKLFKDTSAASHERRLWRVLEELVL
ncbi:MAG: hypothetical protein AAB250_16035 [Bdellovibrionota bacterium]